MYPDTFGFKDLYLKIVFEKLVQDLPLTQCFDLIFEFIKTYGDNLTSIKLPVL